MTFDEARALFPVLERIAYLNAGSMGPLARPTAEALVEYARRDVERGRGHEREPLDELLDERLDVHQDEPVL